MDDARLTAMRGFYRSRRLVESRLSVHLAQAEGAAK